MNRLLPYPVLIASCALSILADVYVRRFLDIDPFSFSVWVIIPAGAIFLGLLAGSGYSIGCYLAHSKPQWYDAAVLATAIIFTLALTQYFDYSTYVFPNGQRAADLASFETYFDLSIRTSHLKVGRTLNADAGQVGSFGYVLFSIQSLAFLVAGVVNYIIPSSLPACANCSSYLRKVRTKESPSVPAAYSDRLLELCRGDFSQLAWALTWKGPEQPFEAGTAVTSVLYKLYECPHCRRESVISTPRSMTRNGWQEIPKLAIRRDLSPGTTLFAEFK